MNELPRRHNFGKLVFGLAVLAIGAIFLLSNLNVIDSANYLRWWPLLLVAYGLAKLLQPRPARGRMFGFLVAVLGTLILLKDFGKIHFSIWGLWPLALILLGLSIIWGALVGRSRRDCCRPGARVHARFNGVDSPVQVDSDSTLEVNCVFGGNKRVVTSQDFRGGTISTMMGGAEIDLRQAAIAGQEATIRFSVVFGGVELRVPEDWKVVVRTNAVAGNVEDKTSSRMGEGTKTLVLTGDVTFGGIEIRN
jgi:predicted membrane protein